MKVFISGSKKKIVIEGSVKERLDFLMEQNADILIGDCVGVDRYIQEYLSSQNYKNVTVYVSGRQTRNNIGGWNEKHIQVDQDRNSGYGFRLAKDMEMAKNADCGLAVWDGESKGTFVNILNLLALDKKCDMYYLNGAVWLAICSIEDIKPYVGTEGILAAEDFGLVVQKCGFSEEMQEYLVKRGLPLRRIDEVIAQAPISLEKKCDLLNTLFHKRNLLFDLYDSVSKAIKKGRDFKYIKKRILTVLDMHQRCYQDIMEAKEVLNDGRRNPVFYLFDEWYDTDVFIEKSRAIGVFCTPDQVFDRIKKEEKYKDEDTGEGYYRLELWVCTNEQYGEIHQYVHLYNYYIYGNEICWFEKMKLEKGEMGEVYYLPENHDYTHGDLDLNLSTPYKTGDIVRIDCRPFGPPFHAVIAEAREQQWDCCFPNIVFRVPYTGKWRLAALKHRHFYMEEEVGIYEPKLSPLFRIRSVTAEELSKEDDLFLKVQKELSKDENRARKMWEAWNEQRADDITEEQLLKILEAIQG